MMLRTITIAAASTTIIARMVEGVVACQHPNGYVGIYVEDEDDSDILYQLSETLIRPAPGHSALAVAERMFRPN